MLTSLNLLFRNAEICRNVEAWTKSQAKANPSLALTFTPRFSKVGNFTDEKQHHVTQREMLCLIRLFWLGVKNPGHKPYILLAQARTWNLRYLDWKSWRFVRVDNFNSVCYLWPLGLMSLIRFIDLNKTLTKPTACTYMPLFLSLSTGGTLIASMSFLYAVQKTSLQVCIWKKYFSGAVVRNVLQLAGGVHELFC